MNEFMQDFNRELIVDLSYVSTIFCAHSILLPVRPPSRTYWCLGVMLEPYPLDGVYISGLWRRVGRRHFLGTYYFCIAYSS